MSMMKNSIKQEVKKDLSQLSDPVKLIVFTQDMECELCADNRTLMEEVAALSEKVSTEIYDFATDKDPVQRYGIGKIPAVGIQGKKDYGIRFYGVPGGYEFSSLLHAIKIVSKNESGLSSAAKEELKGLTKPVHIQVFVTPTCPYCPAAVQIAHKAAMESELITADMIEIQEFPQLAVKYNVMGVPQTVINESVRFTGALPENKFLQKILEAAK
ncbi:MAG: thioredoxin family protein [Phycisphaerae bacterium]|nr:thioredoxin family protein [Phycisphaerae bacterium]